MANPAEFVQAEATGHMIATFDTLDSRLTHRTERYILSMAIVHLVCLLHVGLAGGSRMVLIFALEADLCLAGRTCDILDFFVSGDHDAITVRFHTVAQEGVRCLFSARAPLA